MEPKPVIPAGYKETKIGVIPEDWDLEKLRSLSNKIGSGVTPKGGKSVYKETGIPLIRSQNVLWGALNLDDIAFISWTQNEKMKSSVVLKDDVLLNITGASIGRVAVSNLDIANVNQHVCIIRGNHKILSDYLTYFLISFFGQKQISQSQAGGNRQGLNFEQVGSFSIPVPPIQEQKKIAKIISTWDRAIEQTHALLEQSKLQKKYLMQQLLTGKKRLLGENGDRFSDDWKEVRLDSVIIEFIVPMRDKPVDLNGNIPWCRIEDIDGIYLSKSKSNQGVTQKTISDMNLKKLPKETLIVSCSADLGKCAITSEELLTNQTFIGLVVNKKKSSVLFLYYLISSLSRILNALSSGTTISYLSRKEFEKFKISCSSISEQHKIASVLTVADQEIEQLEKQMKAYEQEKNYLMQQLLTGKTRVSMS